MTSVVSEKGVHKFESLDHNDDVFATPHQLCDKCRPFAQIFHDYASLIRPKGGLTPEVSYEHHDSFSELVESARDGCHLCSMLSLAADHKETDGADCTKQANSAGPVSLTLERGITQSEKNLCSQFNINLSKTSRNKSLRVHRHTKAPGLMTCRNTLEGYHESPKRAQFRWSLSTGSKVAHRWIDGILDICKTEHELCASWQSQKIFPTRILDLGAFRNSRDVRVVSGHGIDEYVTLSYCWGDLKPSPIVLERCNLEAFRSCIRWDQLPNTMQDAVTVSRRLNVRYLWIDALCIIQGPGGDFQQEAARMQAIYSGSLFTIAAADSDNPLEGCFRARTPLKYRECRVHEDDREVIFVDAADFFPRTPSGEHLERCTLNTRAWVFQERTLSPRTIFFSNDDIFWECREGMICESDLYFTTWNTGLPLKPIFHDLISLDPQDRSKSIMTFQRLWWDILKKYSTKELTKEDDRLSAIAGIVSYPQNLLGMKAIFGIWEQSVIDGLCWYVSSNPEESEVSNFAHIPSWSWIRLRTAEIDNIRNKCGQYITETIYSAAITRLPAPVPFIQLKNLSKSDRILQIRAPVVRCRAYHYPNTEGKLKWAVLPIGGGLRLAPAPSALIYAAHPLNPGATLKPDIDRKFNFMPDSPRMLDEQLDLYCVLLKRELYNDPLLTLHIWDFCLVLERQCGDSGFHYRRVGIYCEDSGLKPVSLYCQADWLNGMDQRDYDFSYDQDSMRRDELIGFLEGRMMMFPKVKRKERNQCTPISLRDREKEVAIH